MAAREAGNLTLVEASELVCLRGGDDAARTLLAELAGRH
jgi:hypothetical protein